MHAVAPQRVVWSRSGRGHTTPCVATSTDSGEEGRTHLVRQSAYSSAEHAHSPCSVSAAIAAAGILAASHGADAVAPGGGDGYVLTPTLATKARQTSRGRDHPLRSRLLVAPPMITAKGSGAPLLQKATTRPTGCHRRAGHGELRRRRQLLLPPTRANTACRLSRSTAVPRAVALPLPEALPP